MVGGGDGLDRLKFIVIGVCFVLVGRVCVVFMVVVGNCFGVVGVFRFRFRFRLKLFVGLVFGLLWFSDSGLVVMWVRWFVGVLIVCGSVLVFIGFGWIIGLELGIFGVLLGWYSGLLVLIWWLSFWVCV